jgi:hypothetical protein
MSTFKNQDGSTVQEDFGIGAKISHLSHPAAASIPARHGAEPNIARDASRGKEVREVPIHGGMLEKQKNAFQMGGMAHATESGGEPTTNKNPLTAKLAPVKDHTKPVRTTFGQRDRNGGAYVFDHRELGRAIMDEATRSGGMDCAEMLPSAPKFK